MNSLVMHDTATAQWQALVHEAEDVCHTQLGEELESYLVFLLARYLSATDISNSILALEYLQGQELVGQRRTEQLQDVGDKCLLYSGLFPGRAERQRVRISYYVELGRTCYATLADSVAGLRAGLYGRLSARFVVLMDVLHTTRELGHDKPALEPLQAIELWNDTGSQHAFSTLKRYTKGTPVKVGVTLANAHYGVKNTQQH